jgi:amino acid transporter
MLFAFVICLLFTIGDVDRVISTPTGVPLIEVYYQATNSKGATTFLVLMPILIIMLAMFNVYASTSRLVWAFSKDKGLPFSKFFSTVSFFKNMDYNE